MATIQKPSKGRIVIYTAYRGQGASPQRAEAEQALEALALELPEAVYDDAAKKIRAAFEQERVDVDEYVGIVTQAHGSVVDIKTFGPHSIYDTHSVPYDANGAPGTWRYPPREEGTIEI